MARWIVLASALGSFVLGAALGSTGTERAAAVARSSDAAAPSSASTAARMARREGAAQTSAARRARARRSSAPSADTGADHRAPARAPERERCAAAYLDRDGDGFGGALAGCLYAAPQGLVANGLDCDDTRSDVHPGVPEVCDGEVDNDCDGAANFCGALPHRALRPGDLAIRAVQDHMNDVDDALCEWFEIENRTSSALELMGLEVRDAGLDGFRIRRSLVLAPGGRAVLGRSGDPRSNGGVAVDYVYSDFILSNAGDSIELRSDGRVIDRLTYAR